MPMQDADRWTPVRTGRLLLRRPEPADEAAAVRLHLDPRTNVHDPSPGPVTAAQAARTFHVISRHWRSFGFGVWATALPEEPAGLVGFAGVSHRVVQGRPALNLYYRFHPDYWGRGLATDAASAAVRLAREHLPGLPVVAYTTEENEASQRTALAAGLERRPDLDVEHRGRRDIYLAADW